MAWRITALRITRETRPGWKKCGADSLGKVVATGVARSPVCGYIGGRRRHSPVQHCVITAIGILCLSAGVGRCNFEYDDDASKGWCLVGMHLDHPQHHCRLFDSGSSESSDFQQFPRLSLCISVVCFAIYFLLMFEHFMSIHVVAIKDSFISISLHQCRLLMGIKRKLGSLPHIPSRICEACLGRLR